MQAHTWLISLLGQYLPDSVIYCGSLGSSLFKIVLEDFGYLWKLSHFIADALTGVARGYQFNSFEYGNDFSNNRFLEHLSYAVRKKRHTLAPAWMTFYTKQTGTIR